MVLSWKYLRITHYANPKDFKIQLNADEVINIRTDYPRRNDGLTVGLYNYFKYKRDKSMALRSLRIIGSLVLSLFVRSCGYYRATWTFWAKMAWINQPL